MVDLVHQDVDEKGDSDGDDQDCSAAVFKVGWREAPTFAGDSEICSETL